MLPLLLVEDDEDFAGALTVRLEKRNFTVIRSVSGEAALEILKDVDAEVIVSDIKLPGMDGMEFLSRVREIKKDLPVILITGYASLESAKSAVKFSAADYILKPLENIDDLLNPVYKAVYSYELVTENKNLVEDLRKKIEELEISESKYRNLFEMAGDMICTITSEGIITSINKRMEEIIKYEKEEIIGKSALKLFPSAEEGLFQKRLQEILENGKTNIVEVKMTSKNGEEICGEIGIKLICGKDRAPEIQCIIRDISEHKKIEEALKRSEAELLEQKNILERKNYALKEVLEQIEVEKKQIKSDIVKGVDKLVFPLLSKLRGKIDPSAVKYVDIVERNLREITSSFARKITESNLNLTPREIEISNMIKNGFSSKEISKILNMSIRTAERHRNNIRKKLGIVKDKVNLTTYLQMI
ncbi:MAG: PAS domain S-box protein [Candidatus Omnitrophota bacterium]